MSDGFQDLRGREGVCEASGVAVPAVRDDTLRRIAIGLIRLGWSPPRPTARIAARILDDMGSVDPRASLDLSVTELRLLAGFADGVGRRDLAEDMGVTVQSLQAVQRSALEKLGARTTTQAVARAVARGLVEVDA